MDAPDSAAAAAVDRTAIKMRPNDMQRLDWSLSGRVYVACCYMPSSKKKSSHIDNKVLDYSS